MDNCAHDATTHDQSTGVTRCRECGQVTDVRFEE